MKRGIRIIGIDDAPFKRGDKSTALVAAVMRFRKLEDILITRVEVDGADSTQKIISLLRKKYGGQGKILFLHSITVGGLNIVDIDRLSRALNCGVICITNRKVHGDNLVEVLKRKFPRRVSMVKPIHKVGRYYISYSGINYSDVVGLVRRYEYEPIRLADMIARCFSEKNQV